MNKKVILITGATGMLGSNILKNLIKLGYGVIVLKRSFSNVFRIEGFLDKVITYDIDLIELERVFIENKIDVVLHTATQYGRKKTKVYSILESNLLLPLELIDLSERYGVSMFINTDTILNKNINSYSLSKNQFSEWLIYYSDGMQCINVSIEHFYGAYDDNSKFVSFIIGRLSDRVESIDLTFGDQERDFVYISDVVDAFIAIITHKNSENGLYEYEIGSGENVTIKSFVLLVASMLNNSETKLNFGAVPYRKNEVMRSHVDLRALINIGWSPKVDLKKGLKYIINRESKKQ
jgi:CDP-paratose synthetase